MVEPAELIRACALPRHEAERLLLLASGRSRAALATGVSIDAEAALRFEQLVARRAAGMPLQYLEGTVQFGPLELYVDERALIPRPETERMWERVVAQVGTTVPKVIVDLCTGSGNLALALKYSFPDAVVFGTDASREALSLASENGHANGIDVVWLMGDLFEALPGEICGTVDVLVSNPPYIAIADYDGLPTDVRDHEPIDALIAGPAGDEVFARIARGAGEWLRPGGLLACEIGADQGHRVRQLFAAFDPVVERDLAGRDRYVFGRSHVG